MSDLAVSVEHVYKSFGNEYVLQDVSLGMEKGKIYGLVGRNGSGKTVLMKCILGFMKPEKGRVHVFGQEVGKLCDFAPDTGMMIENPGFLPGESGLRNLMWLAKLGKKADARRVEEMIRLVGLKSAQKKKVGQYSMGMRQRLGIAQALLEDPALLVLDEPMNGLDHQGVQEMRRLFRDLRDSGKTILLASHFAQDIEELCDEVWHMEKGKVPDRSWYPYSSLPEV